MKGIVFNLLEEFVVEGWGAERFEKLIGQCPLHTKTAFVGPGTYPDSDLFMIVEKATAELGVSTYDALRAFGRFAFLRLAGKFTPFVSRHEHPKEFLKTVDQIIHVEVRKLFQHSEPPRITFEEPSNDCLILTYSSRRRLCPFFSGLVDGTGDYFAMTIVQSEGDCMLRGAPHCIFTLQFPADHA